MTIEFCNVVNFCLNYDQFVFYLCVVVVQSNWHYNHILRLSCTRLLTYSLLYSTFSLDFVTHLHTCSLNPQMYSFTRSAGIIELNVLVFT